MRAFLQAFHYYVLFLCDQGFFGFKGKTSENGSSAISTSGLTTYADVAWRGACGPVASQPAFDVERTLSRRAGDWPLQGLLAPPPKK